MSLIDETEKNNKINVDEVESCVKRGMLVGEGVPLRRPDEKKEKKMSTYKKLVTKCH